LGRGTAAPPERRRQLSPCVGRPEHRLRGTCFKRDGTREPWDREKLEAGIRKSLTGRPVTNLQIDQMLDRIEARIRKKGPEVPSNVVGAAVLAAMQKIDDVGYLRYASVYKDFQAAGDFERELGLLLEKKEPAKRRRKG